MRSAANWEGPLRSDWGQRFAWAAATGVALLFFTVGHQRAAEWHDSVTLWKPLTAQISDDPRLHANLARGYLRRGDLESASRSLRDALRIDPDHVSALNNLAVIELERGRYDPARELHRRVLGLDPTSFVAWTNLGTIETRLLNHADSLKFYRRALELNPNHQSALNKLAKGEAMLAEARRYLEEHPLPDSQRASQTQLQQHALAQLVVGNRQTAVEIYRVLRERSADSERWRVPQLDMASSAELALDSQRR
jgi:Tfp pilus assembly protein PilF